LMMKYIDTENEDYYFQYKDLLDKIDLDRPLQSIKMFFVFERVYNAKKDNLFPHNKAGYDRMVTTYRNHLERGLLLQHGYLRKNIIVNLMRFAVKRQEYGWIYDFLEKWKDKIGNINQREEYLNHCWASYYFLIKDYEKAEKLLTFSYTDKDFFMISKRMRLIILFEQKDIALLSYESEAFKVQLHRFLKGEEIKPEIFELNNVFNNALRLIIDLQYNPKQSKKESILKKITTKRCADKEWLISKLDLIKC
jgi:hypothetical protein